MTTNKKILCLLLLVFLFVTGCDKTPAPEETIKQFIQHWQNAAYEEAYQLLTVEAREEYPWELFRKRYKDISTGIGLTGVTIKEITVNEQADGQVEAHYLLEFTTTTVPQFEQEYTAVLHKGEGKWLLAWDHELIFPGLKSSYTVRLKREVPPRGSIYDRNNIALANTGQIREIGVVPGRIADERNLLQDLAVLLEMSEEAIKNAYSQSWVQPEMYVPIKKISEAYWQEKKEQFLAIKGVMIQQKQGRVYNCPSSLAQTVGYIAEISAEQLEEKRALGYRAGDFLGVTGMEEVFEEELAGTIGFNISIYDENNKFVSEVAKKEAIAGKDIKTTLDSSLQQIADKALTEKTGAVVLLQASTGEVLSLSSKPGFDSNLFALGITAAQYERLGQLNSPFLNRSLAALLPPGSTFKPFTALMALAAEAVDPAESWNTPKQWQANPSWGGYYVTRVDRPGGAVDLEKAMIYSDNVYFADLSLKIGSKRFIQYAEQLGFNQQLPFVLKTHSSEIGGDNLSDIMLADSGYGQGQVQLTPLHLALMFSIFPREDGTIPAPQILAGQEPTVWLESGFTVPQIAQVAATLGAAVQSPDAVAAAGNLPGLNIKGKTGTAEISDSRQIGWYACYFEDYVLVVALEGDRTMTSNQAIEVANKIIQAGIF